MKHETSPSSIDSAAILAGATLFPQPRAGYLILKGPHRSDLLQRLSSNDLRLLQAGNVIVTCLSSPTGRVLDVLSVFSEGETLHVLTLPGYGEATFRYLKSRIFFMDQVSLSDEGSAYAQFDLDGLQAAQFLQPLGVNPAPGLDQIMAVDWEERPLRVIGQRGVVGLGYRLILPREAAQDLEACLEREGVRRLSAEDQHILRLEAGLPAAGAELTQEFTPLEVGLEWTISSTKGCYSGQEVIARQITYDKVTQRLRGLRLEHAVRPQMRLWAGGKLAGVVTSAGISPRLGPIALAVVRRPYDQPGTILMVGDTPDRGITARVVALPMSSI